MKKTNASGFGADSSNESAHAGRRGRSSTPGSPLTVTGDSESGARGPLYSQTGMRRLLDYSLERGVLSRFIAKLPPDEAARLRLRLRRLARPARLGTLRRTSPLSHDYGYDRGNPIDRYYIERFLSGHRSQIRGRVLEVKDSTYTERFGSGVTQKDVLDIDLANPRATIITDLAAADAISEASFDCFILTQTLQLIYDVRSAIAQAYRILKPAGVLLVTVPALSPIVREGPLTDYWRFTNASCAALFSEAFGHEAIDVREYGNVLTAIAFLTGMAYEELSAHELEAQDARFTMLVSVSAVKR
jgi:SAM-dependent methyltransferase